MTSPLSIGQKAPDFDLAATNPSKPDVSGRVKRDDFAGQYLILYFYPRDNTPGCTTQALAFTQHREAFAAENAAILGISADSLASHEKFADKKNLGIPLGADDSLEVCKAYNVWVEKKMYGKTFMGIQRTTFLISPQQKILHVWNKVKVKEHVTDVLSVLARAKGDR